MSRKERLKTLASRLLAMIDDRNQSEFCTVYVEYITGCECTFGNRCAVYADITRIIRVQVELTVSGV